MWAVTYAIGTPVTAQRAIVTLQAERLLMLRPISNLQLHIEFEFFATLNDNKITTLPMHLVEAGIDHELDEDRISDSSSIQITHVDISKRQPTTSSANEP
jgi:hypothetical protein